MQLNAAIAAIPNVLHAVICFLSCSDEPWLRRSHRRADVLRRLVASASAPTVWANKVNTATSKRGGTDEMPR